MKTYEQYMCALLRNPEWFKSTVARYGRHDTIGAPELATAVSNLESALRQKFDLDDDATDSPELKEFDAEAFARDSDPPRAL